MIRPDIQALCAEWIGTDGLRIQDRIIAASYVPDLCNATGAPLYGQLRIDNLDEGRFTVRIQDPATWPVGGSRALSQRSIEEALVHELVHIRWIDLTAANQDAASLVQEERATWATAQALVAAKYDKRAADVRAMVRAMSTGKTSALTRAQTKGRAMIDATTAKQILDALGGEDIEAMKAALRGIVEAALTSGDNGPPSGADGASGMGADAGNNGADPNKDRPPMNMNDEQQKYSRAMRAHLSEAATSADILRKDAKAAIVRGMRADGLKMTPHAEKQILEAKTIEEAQSLERMARSMSADPVEGAQVPRKGASPPTDRNALAGLTQGQRQSYQRHMRTDPDKAAKFLAQCTKTNAERKGA